MKKIIVLAMLLKVSVFCNAQNISKEYFKFIKQADSLFEVKNYQLALIQYDLAFKANNDQAKVKDRYSAASCWALIKNADSSFYQLNRIVFKGKYADYFQISKDVNFNSLHKDKRWTILMKGIENNLGDESDQLNKQLQQIEQ